MLEKNSEERIDLKNICFSQWFLGNYKKNNNNPPIIKAESSTKVNCSSRGKKSSLTENNTPKNTKKALKPKISCFAKSSEKDLGCECINEGEITAIRNYYFEPRFFESSVKSDGNPDNTLLISNNSPIIIGDSGMNSTSSNNQEIENLFPDFRKRFENNTSDKKILESRKAKFGNECSIIENTDLNTRSCLYLGVKKFKKNLKNENFFLGQFLFSSGL